MGRRQSEARATSRAVLWLGLLAVIAPLAAHVRFFSSDAILYRADSAQLQFVRYKVLCETLQNERTLPLWQNWIYGGSPFHASPENPTLYPPIVAFASLLSPVATINATVLFHLALASLGMYCLVVRLWRRLGSRWCPDVDRLERVAAAGGFVAALVFSLNLWTRLFDSLNLVAYGAADALIPWMLWSADRLLHSERPRRAAGLLALFVAAEFFTGGLYVIPYAYWLLIFWFVAFGLFGSPEARARTLRYGSLAALAAGLMVAAKILPYRDWVPTTNREGALPYDEALGQTLNSVRVWWFSGRCWAFVPALFSLLLVRLGVVRWTWILGGFFFAVAFGTPAYRVAYDFMPPLDQVRNARRAWVAINALLPLAAGFGACWLAARLPSRFAAWAGLALGLGLIPGLLDSHRFSESLSTPESFVELKTRYTHWPRAAELAGDEWRTFFFDKNVPDGRCEQFITGALGVETVAGYLGHVWPRKLERHLYMPDGAPMNPDLRHRRLATLSVRYLVTRDPAAPPAAPPRSFDPPGIDGTTVAENPIARPRAFFPAAAYAVAGDVDDEALYALLDTPAFPVHAASVLSPQVLFDTDEIAAIDELVLVRGSADADTWRQLAGEVGVPVIEIDVPLDAPGRESLRALARRAATAARDNATRALPFERTGSRETRIGPAEPPGAERRFAVVSEPWSLYAGWNARTSSGAAVTVHAADSLSSAVLMLPGESLSARYSPDAVFWGLCAGLLGLLWALVLIVSPRP